MGNIVIEDESGKVIYYGKNMFDLVDSLIDKGLTALETEAMVFVVAATHDSRQFLHMRRGWHSLRRGTLHARCS